MVIETWQCECVWSALKKRICRHGSVRHCTVRSDQHDYVLLGIRPSGRGDKVGLRYLLTLMFQNGIYVGE